REGGGLEFGLTDRLVAVGVGLHHHAVAAAHAVMPAAHAAMTAHPVALALFGIARFRDRGGALLLPFGALRLAVGAMLVPVGLADAAVAVRVERSEALGL